MIEIERLRALPQSEESVRLLDAEHEKLRRVVINGAKTEAMWQRELPICTDMLRKLKQAERLKLENDHMMLSVDEMMHLAGLVSTLSMQFIPEHDRDKFRDGLCRLSRGEPIQLGDGVELR